jgi:tetratricopeptide (TPR) repeat protein
MRWLRELFDVRRSKDKATDLASWNAAEELGLPDLDPATPAAFYGALYHKRFGYRPKLGQEFLRSQILGRTPSYGYAALAQIQTESAHKYAVTTNFDHLLEEAHRRYLNRELIVCASDDQAATVQRLPDQPLLAKVHGDIFHETKNDANYIAELRSIWFDPLRAVFGRYIPLFVGYGGNDPGFMTFLTDGVASGWFPDKLVWTYHEESGAPNGALLDKLSAKHDVLLVPIPGFDEFLFLFGEALELTPLTKRLEADFASRIRTYQESYDHMAASLRAVRPADARPGGALDRNLAPAAQRSWWEWREAARNAPTYPEGREILEEGLRYLPQSPQLRSFYSFYRATEYPQDPEAEASARAAVGEAEQQFGPDHPNTLTCVNHLASLLATKGDRVEAESLFRRTLEVRERVLGPDHPDTLTSVNNLASLLRAKGDSAGAEPLYRRALEVRERVLGPDHRDTLASVNNLANIIAAKRDFLEAEPLYRRALEGRERVFGPDHPDTLTSASNLAILIFRKGDRANAEPLYRRVLEVRERVLGPDHPDTLTSASNLAKVLTAKGDHVEAERLNRRALEVRERVLGPDHPDTLTSISNLGNLLSGSGDLGGAESLLRRALSGRERVLGEDHPETLIAMGNLALILHKKGDDSAAEPLYRRALAGRERVLGHDHTDTLASASNLASTLDAMGDQDSAEVLYRRALESRKRTLGPGHPATLQSAKALATFNSKKRLPRPRA